MRGDNLSCKKNWEKHERIDKMFAEEIRDIIRERIKLGLEDPINHNGTRRVTKAMIRTSVWPQMKEILIQSNFEEDRWIK